MTTPQYPDETQVGTLELEYMRDGQLRATVLSMAGEPLAFAEFSVALIPTRPGSGSSTVLMGRKIQLTSSLRLI